MTTNTISTRIFTNDRTGEKVSTELTNRELLNRFSDMVGETTDSWLMFWIAKAVNSRGSRKAVKRTMHFLADLFMLPIGCGNKRPMIRLHYKGQRFKVYLSKKGTLCFKSGNLRPSAIDPVNGTVLKWSHDPVGDEFYIGCLFDGKILPAKEGWGSSRVVREFTETENEFFTHLLEEPVEFLARCSKDLNRCCYCNQPLEDERSKAVGYGAICASKWGLPWGGNYDEKVPSFADLWDQDVHAILETIRRNPQDEFNWVVLNDWLEENGLSMKTSVPATSVTIPACK